MKRTHKILNQAELLYNEINKFSHDKDNLPQNLQVQGAELMAFFIKIRTSILEDEFEATESWQKKKTRMLVEVLKTLLLHVLRNNLQKIEEEKKLELFEKNVEALE